MLPSVTWTWGHLAAIMQCPMGQHLLWPGLDMRFPALDLGGWALPDVQPCRLHDDIVPPNVFQGRTVLQQVQSQCLGHIFSLILFERRGGKKNLYVG